MTLKNSWTILKLKPGLFSRWDFSDNLNENMYLHHKSLSALGLSFVFMFVLVGNVSASSLSIISRKVAEADDKNESNIKNNGSEVDAVLRNAEKAKLLPLEVLQISPEPHLNTNFLLTDKEARKMYVFKNSDDKKNLVQVTEFNIDIGKNNGPKTKRDDHKTPEGIYRLETKKTQPEIPFDQYGIMAFTTDYPNVFDKFENKTGSGIWLHSVPDKVPLTRGSRGCVVIRNNDLKIVDPLIKLKRTFMIINDKIHWVPSEEHDKEHDKALTWINNWKDLWAAQDIDAYIKLYSDKFTAPGFKKESWYKHKSKLKDRYKFTKVTLSEPNIFKIKNHYLFQVIQDYESDGHKDHGVKNLYATEDNGEIKIVREEWFEVKD